VLELIRPESVVDIGCATGAWLSVFYNQGVKNILGLDGAYINHADLLIPPDCFRPLDLEQPFSLSERFDLAISLEVAEHLPAASSEGFVKSVCQLAPVVLFSAAIPGQGGIHHLNEQWPEYWRQKFANEEFTMFDPFRPKFLYDERVAPYYRQNVFLFISNSMVRGGSRFCHLPRVKDEQVLMIIAPHVFFGIRATLTRLRHMILQRLQSKFMPKNNSKDYKNGQFRE
jgi:hypothetical protein